MTSSVNCNSTERFPKPREVVEFLREIRPFIKKTPVLGFDSRDLSIISEKNRNVWMKLELMQFTGSFKTRAVMGILSELRRRGKSPPGVVTASGGNHALALAYGANKFGVKSAVVMPKYASSLRVRACEELGAEVILVDGVSDVFPTALDIEQNRGYEFVHPFDGFLTTMGTATVAHEFLEEVPPLDYVIVPVGGGGLISGIAAYVKQTMPSCKVIGVEPKGANVMSLALAKGMTTSLPDASSIADSLCCPITCEYSFKIVKTFVDDIVLVGENQILDSVGVMQEDAKLAVEPAAACGLAAILGPLNEETEGKNVGIIVCGSNIDTHKYCSLLDRMET